MNLGVFTETTGVDLGTFMGLNPMVGADQQGLIPCTMATSCESWHPAARSLPFQRTSGFALPTSAIHSTVSKSQTSSTRQTTFFRPLGAHEICNHRTVALTREDEKGTAPTHRHPGIRNLYEAGIGT